jgi:hypothetical protein
MIGPMLKKCQNLSDPVIVIHINKKLYKKKNYGITILSYQSIESFFKNRPASNNGCEFKENKKKIVNDLYMHILIYQFIVVIILFLFIFFS